MKRATQRSMITGASITSMSTRRSCEQTCTSLVAKLPDFVKLLDEGLRRPAGGYYDWSDVDGKVRKKYMYLTQVQGTNLVVAATTYIDEFSQPAKKIVGTVNQMEASYAAHYNWRFLLFLLIVVVDLAILLAVIYLFSFSVVRPIRHLSEAADRISHGRS